MYAETSEKKMSNSRIAFALLCGLAVCCSVMYITADAGDEYVHEIIHSDSAKAYDAGTSVGSTDVLKAGQIYTETPDGRMRLMDYFNNVETEIADEVANRKSDIAAVRAQMARDFAFNAGARAKLKRDMLHKMAINAKIARDDLMAAMRKTQERFAKQARLANRRYKATLRRDKKTKKLVEHDKAEAAHNLKLAVTAWQKSTNAWAAATNARIDRMNKHVAANAAQIKENARKARKDLEMATADWDHKVANFRTDSKRARSELSEQFAAQDRATRQWANNKIKGLIAHTSAQFNDVEITMAKNRHEVDMALRQATMRFEAALNAAKALEDQRYASTVADIEATKREAAEKVNEASTEFKVALLGLSSTVKEQVQSVNERIDSTADVVRSDAAAQAKVNANVNAEMARMVKLGNKRYKKHLRDDAELQNLISKDKAETDEKLNKMALQFNAALADVRKQLAKDRKHAEDQLTKKTDAVWTALRENQKEQAQKNADMEAETRRVRLDAMDAVRVTKEEFRKKIADLGKVVAANDKKADKKIEDLTGIVAEEAAKSAKGRQELAELEEANKNELKAAIKKAIATGEKRAKQVEANGEKMDKDTRWLINNRLTNEINHLRDETDASVESLALQSKEARDEMKKEMLYAIRSAAEVAEKDLALAVEKGTEKMKAFLEKAGESHAASAEARQALKDEIADNAKEVSRMIKDAVATDARAKASLYQETAAAIKKTNTDLDAYAKQMDEIAKKTRADIKALNDKTLQEIKTENERVSHAVEGFTADDAARQSDALKFMEEQLEIAGKASDKKFGEAYEKLAADRKKADEELAAATEGLNDSLAKQAALADSRFSKTVKDLGAARKQAAQQVSDFRAEFAAEIAVATSELEKTQQILVDDIAKVSGEVISLKANQVRVNKRVNAELARVEKLSNDRFTQSKDARGKLRQLMDENKEAASAEVKELESELLVKLQKARDKNAAHRKEMADDLEKATSEFYEKLSAQQKAQQKASEALNENIATEKAAAAAAVEAAHKKFDSKIIMLTDQVAAHAETAAKQMGDLRTDVEKYAEASEQDRALIRKTTETMMNDVQQSLEKAISIGEAKAKAVEQRIAEHLEQTKRFLQVELNEQVETAADSVFKLIEGKRQKMADNYLSLKAYAVSAADDVQDYVAEGKGRGLSSIGDLLITVGALGAVHAKAEVGVGMGGDSLPSIFSGETVKVSNAVAAINGLVNEYTSSCSQVRNRWPMGLGKYLLDKLEMSMMDKGVLQVDKVDGKSGNFVFMNGHSVGLSNKLSDFASLAARMTTYESVLAKMTSKITSPMKPAEFSAPPPEWEGK